VPQTLRCADQACYAQVDLAVPNGGSVGHLPNTVVIAAKVVATIRQRYAAPGVHVLVDYVALSGGIVEQAKNIAERAVRVATVHRK